MKPPPVPSDEEERLADLRAHAVLDTGVDDAFDAVTRTVAQVLGVPIALVSLVDAERQWFKSHHGLDVTETHRDLSFCGHVVGSGAPLVVEDALEDPRFADNPLVTGEPRIRFYAGVPLRTADGHDLGTLCAVDRAPRALDPLQLRILTDLARVVVELMAGHRKQARLDRKRALLAAQEEQLRTLFDAMAEGVVVQGSNGLVVAANAAAYEILGLDEDQLASRIASPPAWRLVREDGSTFPREQLPGVLAWRENRASRHVVAGVEQGDGELRWVQINALPLRTEDGRGSISTFHDITALKVAQAARERLAQNERLITVGTLAAGVGHEINNPLTFVLANLELAMEELGAIAGGSPSGRMRELVDALGEAREGAERIRRIVRGLRALAREDPEAPGAAPAAAIDISVQIAGHELRTRARLIQAVAETPLVALDESRLSQVLVNLLVNAAQSFPSSDPERNEVRVEAAAEPNGWVRLTVRDNGPGIAPDVLRRVFDPFFTTKPVGQGTGLGLSICHGIVTAAQGRIEVETVLGEGTSFHVWLPAVAPAAGRAPSSTPPGHAAARACARHRRRGDGVANHRARAVARPRRGDLLGSARRRASAGERGNLRRDLL